MSEQGSGGSAPIRTVATTLGLEIVGSAEGGEFGAVFVRNRAGNCLVLKVVRGAEAAPAWALGARLAGVMLETGYPCPRYEGTGSEVGWTWSLQHALPGSLPPRATGGQLRQLIALAERHAGRAPAPEAQWAERAVAHARLEAQRLERAELTGPFGSEMNVRLTALDRPPVRTGDVMHGDFHHRNYLADADTVTGVFDWEGASVGDWRFDLATLAFWSAVVPEQMSAEGGAAAAQRLAAVCPDQLTALFGALLAVRVIGFYATFRPELLSPILPRIEAHVAPWWR